MRGSVCRKLPLLGLWATGFLACAAGMLAAQGPSGLQQPEGVKGFTSINKYAVIVGINAYSGEQIPDLKYAVSDAQALHKVLTDPRLGGFQTENVDLLTDTSENPPTAANIGKALRRMVSQSRENDLALVFFSGHGYEEEGRAYLLPSDADIDALDYTAIERDAFVRQIDKISASKVVVILDACHAGGISRGGKAVGSDTALSNHYYDMFFGSKGRAFIASCSGGQLSWEDEQSGHGVFTNSLVRGLSGVADTQPRDGLVTLSELRRFLEEDVSDWARSHGKTQQPQASLEAAYGDMPLALNTQVLDANAEMREARLREAEALKVGLVSKAGVEPDELAAAVTLLDRMAAGEELTTEETQHVLFLRRLMDGSIDLSMYRIGVRGLISSVLRPEPRPDVSPKRWYATGLVGVGLFFGDDFSRGNGVTPSLSIGYSFGRWAMAASYVLVTGELASDDYLKGFTAHLVTVAPRINAELSPKLMYHLQIGLGSYFGSEIRNDRMNLALDVGAGLERAVSRRLSVGLQVSWSYSNAALISPAEPQLNQGIRAGISMKVAGKK